MGMQQKEVVGKMSYVVNCRWHGIAPRVSMINITRKNYIRSNIVNVTWKLLFSFAMNRITIIVVTERHNERDRIFSSVFSGVRRLFGEYGKAVM